MGLALVVFELPYARSKRDRHSLVRGALGLRADNESINFNDSGSLKRVSMEDVVVQLINRYGLKVAFVRAPITKEITYQQRIEEIERTPEVQRTRDENTTIEQLSSWIKEKPDVRHTMASEKRFDVDIPDTLGYDSETAALFSKLVTLDPEYKWCLSGSVYVLVPQSLNLLDRRETIDLQQASAAVVVKELTNLLKRQSIDLDYNSFNYLARELSKKQITLRLDNQPLSDILSRMVESMDGQMTWGFSGDNTGGEVYFDRMPSKVFINASIAEAHASVSK